MSASRAAASAPTILTPAGAGIAEPAAAGRLAGASRARRALDCPCNGGCRRCSIYDPRNFDHRVIVDLRLVRLAARCLPA